jgi:hypothetical protein
VLLVQLALPDQPEELVLQALQEQLQELDFYSIPLMQETLRVVNLNLIQTVTI